MLPCCDIHCQVWRWVEERGELRGLLGIAQLVLLGGSLSAEGLHRSILIGLKPGDLCIDLFQAFVRVPGVGGGDLASHAREHRLGREERAAPSGRPWSAPTAARMTRSQKAASTKPVLGPGPENGQTVERGDLPALGACTIRML